MRRAGRLYRAAVLIVCAAGAWAVSAAAADGPVAQAILPLSLGWGLFHAAVYLFLLWLFGRTLRPGSVAIVTRVARRVHGTLPPEIEAYTRRVTQGWCLFFVFQIGASALLLAMFPLPVWTFFTVVLNFPLLVLMFASEYGYRVLRFPDHPHASIAKTLRAFGEAAAFRSDAEAG